MSRRLWLLISPCLLAGQACAPRGSDSVDTVVVATAPPPPDPDTLLAIASGITGAWIAGDRLAFDTLLSEQFVDFKAGFRVTKQGLVAMVGENRCHVPEWRLDDPQVARLDSGVYVLSYRGTFDGSCVGPDSVTHKMLSPTRAASIFLSEGSKWRPAFHSENRIIATPPRPGVDASAAAPSVALHHERSDSVAPHSDILATHVASWSAITEADTARARVLISERLAALDERGRWTTGRAEAITQLKYAPGCRVTRVSLEDAEVRDLGADIKLITTRVHAPNSCQQAHTSLRFQTAAYVRVDKVWQLAFLMDAGAT